MRDYYTIKSNHIQHQVNFTINKEEVYLAAIVRFYCLANYKNICRAKNDSLKMSLKNL